MKGQPVSVPAFNIWLLYQKAADFFYHIFMAIKSKEYWMKVFFSSYVYKILTGLCVLRSHTLQYHSWFKTRCFFLTSLSNLYCFEFCLSRAQVSCGGWFVVLYSYFKFLGHFSEVFTFFESDGFGLCHVHCEGLTVLTEEGWGSDKVSWVAETMIRLSV